MMYAWYWNEEPDFALPHADHIEIMDEVGGEVCIIVVRKDVKGDRSVYMKQAEEKARKIVNALIALEEGK